MLFKFSIILRRLQSSDCMFRFVPSYCWVVFHPVYFYWVLPNFFPPQGYSSFNIRFRSHLPMPSICYMLLQVFVICSAHIYSFWVSPSLPTWPSTSSQQVKSSHVGAGGTVPSGHSWTSHEHWFTLAGPMSPSGNLELDSHPFKTYVCILLC